MCVLFYQFIALVFDLINFSGVIVGFLLFFFPLRSLVFIVSMSVEREIDDIVEDEQSDRSQDEVEDSMAVAAQEVANLLSATGDSFERMCADIEPSKSHESCRLAFRRFNKVLRIFILSGHDGALLHEAIRLGSFTA